MNTRSSIEEAINGNVEDMVTIISDISERNSRNLEDIRALIVSSNFSYKYELLKVPEKYFLNTLLLCLLYSAINPELVRTPIMVDYQSKISKVCNHFGIDPNLITPISEIEKKVYQVLV